MQENEPRTLVEKVAGDIEGLLARKVQALKVGASVGMEGGPGGVALHLGAPSSPPENPRPPGARNAGRPPRAGLRLQGRGSGGGSGAV